ncbi:MAG: hypothetical protein P8166_06205 [Candidatus Thiodiazotropha sp.]
MNKIKACILASLLMVILGNTGCSTSPYHEQPPEKKSEPTSKTIDKGIIAPKREGGSDDMERLE